MRKRVRPSADAGRWFEVDSLTRDQQQRRVRDQLLDPRRGEVETNEKAESCVLICFDPLDHLAARIWRVDPCPRRPRYEPGENKAILSSVESECSIRDDVRTLVSARIEIPATDRIRHPLRSDPGVSIRIIKNVIEAWTIETQLPARQHRLAHSSSPSSRLAPIGISAGGMRSGGMIRASNSSSFVRPATSKPARR